MIACYPPARRNQALTSLRESSPCQRMLPVASNWSHSLGNVAHRCGCRGGCYDRRSSRSPRPQTCRHNDRRSVKGGRVISVARHRHDRCGDGTLRKRAECAASAEPGPRGSMSPTGGPNDNALHQDSENTKRSTGATTRPCRTRSTASPTSSRRSTTANACTPPWATGPRRSTRLYMGRLQRRSIPTDPPVHPQGVAEFATVRFVTTVSRCTSTRGKEGPDLRQEAGPAFFSRDVTRSIAKRS